MGFGVRFWRQRKEDGRESDEQECSLIFRTRKKERGETSRMPKRKKRQSSEWACVDSENGGVERKHDVGGLSVRLGNREKKGDNALKDWGGRSE